MKFIYAVKNTKVINDMPYMYFFFWDHVVIFVNLEIISEIYEHIYNFRLWEKRSFIAKLQSLIIHRTHHKEYAQ